jgi:hypothetical protein
MQGICDRITGYVAGLVIEINLPVQFPTKFEMAVNRRTATALGLAIPPSILLRATEVIE